MKLDRLILINWGQLRPGNYDMGDLTLLTGDTGSGKSTMLDALQTIMTAANKGILNYNPGQDEVGHGQRRGKTRRTLESYVVGAEYNNFSRKDGAQGYMAAVFRPSKGFEYLKPFTAIFAASARVEGSVEGSRQAKLESLQLVIVDDAALSYENFMKNVSASECFSVERIVPHLKSCGYRVSDFKDKKLDYLCALYGRFRGKSSIPKEEATNAAKAWVQTIAYRPIGSVHALVRDEILEMDEQTLQQDIERISGLMRQVSNLRKESQRLKEGATRLSALQDAIARTTKAHEEHTLQGLLVAKLQLQHDDAALEAKAKTIRKSEEAIAHEQRCIAEWKERSAFLDEQSVQLTAKLQGIPVHNQKVELESSLHRAKTTIRAALQEASQSLMGLALVHQRASELISCAIAPQCAQLQAAVTSLVQAYSNVDLQSLSNCRELVTAQLQAESPDEMHLHQIVAALTCVSLGLEEVYNALVGPGNSVLLAVPGDATSVAQELAKAQDKVRDLRSQKSRLSTGRAAYPGYVQRSLELLQENFPQANAQVLCDLVEPKSELWQTAIEAYLGNARFNIIVSPEWERQCIDFLHARGASARIIQGSLCLKDAATREVPEDSIVQELTSRNPVAWAFLVEQYSGVLKVSNTEVLRTTKRGITLQGIGSGGRSMSSKDMGAVNVFGAKAREQAKERVAQELEEAQAYAEQLSAAQKQLQAIRAGLSGLKRPHLDATALREASNVMEKSRAALQTLDISELAGMQEALNRIKAEKLELEASVTSANQRLGEHKSVISNAQKAQQQLLLNQQERSAALQEHRLKLHKLVERNPALSYAELEACVDARATKTAGVLDAARSALHELSVKPASCLVDTRQALAEFNSQAKPDERITSAFSAWQALQSFDDTYDELISMASLVAETLTSLRGVGLYNASLELAQAEKSFHDVFTKQFCVEIKSRVDDGIRTLRQLNGELKNLKFGNDSFWIDWSHWEPEFEEYMSFFEAVTQMADSTEHLDLFATTQLSERHTAIRDRLVQLLLDDNQEKATKELLRIADYRNYRRYDIINETANGGRVKLSEWGTGSGGQLETPAYIVRAAVLTNRLKLFDKAPSLRLMVSDESFAKMDEARIRAVLSFFRDKLDLQFISAMPTMKAGSVKDEFNREYSFTRLSVPNGELDFISECDERIFKKDKMRELWELQRLAAREQAQQLFEQLNPLDTAPGLAQSPEQVPAPEAL